MKKRILLYFIILSISILITYPSFPPSHALDSYCTICNGYTKTAIWFLEHGRIFGYLFYGIFNAIKLPYYSLGIISAFLGNAVLSYAIIRLYMVLKDNCKLANNYYNILLLLLVLLLFYNPLYTSILLFDELFIINMGILFLTLASIYMFEGSFKKYLLSILFIILGLFCYQGIASYYVLISLLLLFSKKQNVVNIKKWGLNIILIIFNFILAFGLNYYFIKLINHYLSNNINQIGQFSIIDNSYMIFTNFIPNSMRYLFGYTNTMCYYSLVGLSFIVAFVWIFRNDKKIYKILILLLLLCSSIMVPFIPNIFMNTLDNYTDARMTLTLGIIPVIIIMFILITYNISKNKLYILYMLSILVLVLTTFSIHQNMMIDLRRYKADIKYINFIKNNVMNYEENNIKINKIYYAYDINSDYYYKDGLNNGANIRVSSVSWALECALKSSLGNDITFSHMDEIKYNEYFNGLDFDDLNQDELVFSNDILYLLIY